MNNTPQALYSPINVLKPVTENVWIVDGPIIRFGMPWPKFSFTTRMTIVRVDNTRLFIHSPTEMSPQLGAQVSALGSPAWIIAPNRIHYWWIPDWHRAFPAAEVYLAPQIRERAGAHINFDTSLLDRDAGYPWDDPITTIHAHSSFMTEFDFFHRPTRTLILTDLIENFEPEKLNSIATRWITKLGGVQDPDGQMPRDMRATFSKKNRQQLRVVVRQMIDWNPQRIIFAHGRWYPCDGAKELQRAFRWLLD